MPMKCDVRKLKNVDGSEIDINLSLTKADLGDSCALALGDGTLDFHGKAVNHGRVITVTAKITCFLQGSCDRCGSEVMIPVEADFKESFSNLTEKLCEESNEEDIYRFEGDEIDLMPYAEQAIFLATPMKILCKENCKGLCPQCGANLNEKECSCDKSPIDPRFAALADLLNKG